MTDFTHIAKPVRVNASRICNASEINEKGVMLVLTEDNNWHELDASMLSRYAPVIDDYIVIQEDGYKYVNPKDVFERKYSPIEENNV
jgi:hypothetical protein